MAVAPVALAGALTLVGCGTGFRTPRNLWMRPGNHPRHPLSPLIGAATDSGPDSLAVVSPVSPIDQTGTIDPVDTVDPADPVDSDAALENFPLVNIEHFAHVGGLNLPGGLYGESELNHARGVIDTEGDRLFIVGLTHHNAIAELAIPELVNSRTIPELNSAGDSARVFSGILNQSTGGNTQSLDTISGMELVRAS